MGLSFDIENIDPGTAEQLKIAAGELRKNLIASARQKPPGMLCPGFEVRYQGKDYRVSGIVNGGLMVVLQNPEGKIREVGVNMFYGKAKPRGDSAKSS